jgi:hypothetical protein
MVPVRELLEMSITEAVVNKVSEGRIGPTSLLEFNKRVSKFDSAYKLLGIVPVMLLREKSNIDKLFSDATALGMDWRLLLLAFSTRIFPQVLTVLEEMLDSWLDDMST